MILLGRGTEHRPANGTVQVVPMMNATFGTLATLPADPTASRAVVLAELRAYETTFA